MIGGKNRSYDNWFKNLEIIFLLVNKGGLRVMGIGNHENFYRKLHSLAGIIPVGVFLTFHLFLNYSAVWGEDAYNTASGFMGNLPFKYALEIFIIFLPLFYHAIYGAKIALQAKNNVGQYKYMRNWMFFFQRLTGFIAFAFVIWHVWQTRVQAELGVHVDFNMMASIVENPLSLVLYIIGILSAIYHFTNGIWTFLITWGITVSPKSQKILQYITIALFFALSFVGLRAIFAFI